jgi:hypothetical protein
LTRPPLQSRRRCRCGAHCEFVAAAGLTLCSRDGPHGTGANNQGACGARPLAPQLGSVGSPRPCVASFAATVACVRAGKPRSDNRPAGATAAWVRMLPRMRCTTSSPWSPPFAINGGIIGMHAASRCESRCGRSTELESSVKSPPRGRSPSSESKQPASPTRSCSSCVARKGAARALV